MKNHVVYETKDGRTYKKEETVDGTQVKKAARSDRSGGQAEADFPQQKNKKSEGKKDE